VAASHRKLLEKEQAAQKLQEEVKAAHDEVVGLEWGAVRGYANAKPKTILRHRLAGEVTTCSIRGSR